MLKPIPTTEQPRVDSCELVAHERTNFLDPIQSRTTTHFHAALARSVVRTAEAAGRSLCLGRQEVALDAAGTREGLSAVGGAARA